MAITAMTTSGIEGQMASDAQNSAEARLIAVVICLAVVLWMGVEYLGAQMSWPVRYVFLADLFAGAAFIWAMIATVRLWRKRQA
jgi:uncharacterized integral membrane protein